MLGISYESDEMRFHDLHNFPNKKTLPRVRNTSASFVFIKPLTQVLPQYVQTMESLLPCLDANQFHVKLQQICWINMLCPLDQKVLVSLPVTIRD